MKIKVCGLFDKDNLKQVLELEPDYIGFNFYPASKRFCKFSELPDLDFGKTEIVGIFVNASAALIQEHVGRFNLSLVQLHGTENVEQAIELKNRLPNCKIIKVFGVEEQSDLKDLQSWASISDFYLFDKKAISFGGTGKKFDWDILNKNPPAKKFFLAGGIGPEDVRSIKLLSQVLPDLFAVDINSRFEDKAGLKQVECIKKFIEELRV